MTTESDRRLAVLSALAERGLASGYARPDVAGFSRDDVDSVVDELRRGGYVEAAWIRGSFGDNPDHWGPSVLTEKGRQLLAELEQERD